MLQIRVEGQSGPHGEIPSIAEIGEQIDRKAGNDSTDDTDEPANQKPSFPDSVQ